jgi:large repetitive protein
MIRSAIVALLLTVSAFASSPEYLVGGATPSPAADLRFSPAVASDGEDFFAVWTDDRAGAGAGAIVGTRITREGQILDPLGLRIATTMGWVLEPQVVWDGSAYLVVWTGSERPDFETNLYAARIAPDGTVVMAPRVIVENAVTRPGRYLASNGTVSVIVYPLDELHVVVLDHEGNTVRHQTISSDHVREPVVAAGTSGFVVAWSANPGFSIEGNVVRALALTASGVITGQPVTIGYGEHPAVGTDGSRYTIVYEKNEEWQQFLLQSRTFEQDLAPVGGERLLMTTRGGTEDAQVLSLGSRYEVTVARQNTPGLDEIVTLELDRDGSPQGPVRNRGPLLQYTYWQRISAATNGSDVLIVRAADGPPQVGLQIYAQRYPGNTTAPSGAPLLLSWSGNAHHDPVIATSGRAEAPYFVAWTEDGGVYATRINGGGHSLDGRGLRLSTFTYAVTRVAFDGTNYVVAWRDDGFVGVRFIAPANGATVAEIHVPVEGYPDVALATAPEATYLVYTDPRVHVVRIPHATHTADPAPLAVSPVEMSAGHPAAAWNGSELLVSWTEEYVHPRADPPIQFSIRVYAARVTAGLSLLDPAPLLLAEGGPTEEDLASFSPPSVASNGTDWLVVTSLYDAEVLARRVLHNGTVEGTAPVKIGDGSAPAVAWDGMRYAVIWKEGTYEDLVRPLILAGVPAWGEPAVTQRTSVARATAASEPAIAPVGNGESAVVYTRVSFRPEHAGVERSFFRVMDFSAPRGRAIRR